jgi:hypothetical protein
MKVTGSCHCAEVTYEAEVDPGRAYICHCTDCQTMSGAPYRVNVPVRSEDLVLRGSPKVYVKTADSGNKRALAFCGNCGSALYSTTVESPRVYMLRVGAIAQRALLAPKRQGFCRSALPWAMDIRSIAGSDAQLATQQSTSEAASKATRL